jgi:hypothetical protein
VRAHSCDTPHSHSASGFFIVLLLFGKQACHAPVAGNPVYQGYGTSNVNRLMYIVEPDKVHGW